MGQIMTESWCTERMQILYCLSKLRQLSLNIVIDSPLAAGERTKHRDLLNSQDLK